MPFQRSEQDSVILLGHASAAHHHEIQATERLSVTPKTFARDPLETVARHGRLGDLARNSQAKAGISQIVGSGQHGETAIAGFDRLGENAGEGVPASQPGATREARVAGTGAQGDKRARPLARRAFKTRRPPRVAMRARNPWVRLR
jgi:hypothetical protein